MSEALDPFNDAVYARLIADPVFVAYLGGEYVLSGALAQDVALDDFVILGSDDSQPFLRFNGTVPGMPREGAICGMQIDCWSKIHRTVANTEVLGKKRVLVMAGHVARILNNVTLITLPSYGFVLTGRAETLSSGRDPDGPLIRARMRYEAIVTRQPGDLP